MFPRELEWRQVAPGIFLASHEDPNIPLRWHMLRVELDTASLKLVCYPSASDMDEQGSFKGISTERFLQQENAIVAVNANPFTYPYGRLNSTRKIVGVFINEGKLLSQPIEKYAAIVFYSDNTGNSLMAEVFASQRDIPYTVSYAFGGFFEILHSGVIQNFNHMSLDSRMAAGTSADKKTLFLLFAEGERRSQSTGISFEESAMILQNAGATDALQLDGGGSAMMSIHNETTAQYHVRKGANIFGFDIAFPLNLD